MYSITNTSEMRKFFPKNGKFNHMCYKFYSKYHKKDLQTFERVDSKFKEIN